MLVLWSVLGTDVWDDSGGSGGVVTDELTQHSPECTCWMYPESLPCE